ncbi:TPA: undecaprenyl/decaprenyl-phosphate alpha-N-acetylglucosaminyl 1-phosphate transferase [Candidatus Berkelbacteria bacterium]|uniref:Undecaprenyl-phosphate N-acetylglucosaminyl 1-phosphate transferase, UDP-N-acetylglucosamine:undecaprenyl-P N-acetylglucosaminyl 1-P transferase n=1 Tax=Berkelbacteria bacterium GW2011_GWE1_39_12 TaxID=1618337 RepID=A0A0G4B2L2_9BACT|nr:MAG: undecaprenyl-phosphate N-acetylglucosaminyl 1-phosphate transferase, UDP-N-acetylglucosamine:undecaprenyl-P N-acetylglucosaminyl 1-P transferase [Berkelbacteria bacterium GW2011_GWE1_39_12]HBO60699.1 undecaprenyl/decaprenyl-phosphate alpha-N-acetylglucosaminyl 1-phosphate transferase [Candidatus Berkelbacteria bacterium]
MVTSLYVAPFVVAALISGGLTYSVIKVAQKFGWADFPSPRKVHTTPTPRLGGVAIVVAFLCLAIGYNLVSTRLNFGSAHIFMFDKKLFGALLGILILLVIGVVDDIRGMKPWQKLIGHFLAAAMVVAFGVSTNYIRLPGGLHVELTNLVYPITLFTHTYHFVVFGDLLTVFWIVLMINTMNFLDGLDGLASGVSLIAGIAIFFLSLSLGQPAAALLAIIFSGAVFGFLPWNFNPAKIFMGDSGSMFLGYMLGVLSVISGGKLATAFLVLGIPLLDVVWVVLRRLTHGKSPFVADRMHLHHRLLAIGFSQRQAVVILYFAAAAFGVVAVLSGTEEKIQALFWLLGIMAILIIVLLILQWRRGRTSVQE